MATHRVGHGLRVFGEPIGSRAAERAVQWPGSLVTMAMGKIAILFLCRTSETVLEGRISNFRFPVAEQALLLPPPLSLLPLSVLTQACFPFRLQ